MLFFWYSAYPSFVFPRPFARSETWSLYFCSCLLSDFHRSIPLSSLPSVYYYRFSWPSLSPCRSSRRSRSQTLFITPPLSLLPLSLFPPLSFFFPVFFPPRTLLCPCSSRCLNYPFCSIFIWVGEGTARARVFPHPSLPLPPSESFIPVSNVYMTSQGRQSPTHTHTHSHTFHRAPALSYTPRIYA